MDSNIRISGRRERRLEELVSLLVPKLQRLTPGETADTILERAELLARLRLRADELD